jgi:hypothetical protein
VRAAVVANSVVDVCPVLSMQSATITEIVKASKLPLSIIIVGVGSADFEAMETLDADDAPLQSHGQTASRDIVQFVPFRDFQGSDDSVRLAAHTLAEVPAQLASYMQLRGVQLPAPLANNRSAGVGGGDASAGAGAGAAAGAGAGGGGAGAASQFRTRTSDMAARPPPVKGTRSAPQPSAKPTEKSGQTLITVLFVLVFILLAYLWMRVSSKTGTVRR